MGCSSHSGTTLFVTSDFNEERHRSMDSALMVMLGVNGT